MATASTEMRVAIAQDEELRLTSHRQFHRLAGLWAGVVGLRSARCHNQHTSWPGFGAGWDFDGAFGSCSLVAMSR